MGIKHRDRIKERLRDHLPQDPALAEQLAGFFDENRDEQFFVKNLERVQGDERDASILSGAEPAQNCRPSATARTTAANSSTGSAPADRGRRTPPQRRRHPAKNRITLVSSFSSRDMDPERSPAAGVKLLRQYLQYIESDGASLGDQVQDKPPLNPFEVDVRDTLLRPGLS